MKRIAVLVVVVSGALLASTGAVGASHVRIPGCGGTDKAAYKPDKVIPQLAARYYWGEVLGAGVKVYQYTRGMMHAKVVIVDDDWASVGTANLDNRSLHLNFEAGCILHSPELVAELEKAYQQDVRDSVRLDAKTFGQVA